MAAKKKIATGPKAKLMKKNLAQLKAQAKKLKIKGFSTKKKEALVNSIMMAQARNNKGKAKKRTMAERDYTPTGTRRSIKRMAKKRGAPANRVMRNPARTGRVMMGQRQTYYEADFKGFGKRELEEVSRTLDMYINDDLTPLAKEYFDESNLKVGYNTNSGFVFLTNDEYQVLLDDGYKLDLYITLPYGGEEGFYDDLMDSYDELEEEDKEYLDSLR